MTYRIRSLTQDNIFRILGDKKLLPCFRLFETKKKQSQITIHQEHPIPLPRSLDKKKRYMESQSLENLGDQEHERKDIIVATVGRVDQGKSSTVGVLTDSSGGLDDGKGLARSRVLVHNHERERGQTSDISQQYAQFGENRVTFIDLAGHEKYLKTTIRGIATYKPDFALVCVAKNFGTAEMKDGFGDPSEEHVKLLTWTGIPFMFLITKIDQTPVQVRKDTIAECKNYVKKKVKGKKVYEIRSEEDITRALQKSRSLVPMLHVSNKTGEGLPLLKSFLGQVKAKNRKLPAHFTVDHVYRVEHTGVVVSGFTGVELKKDETVFLGPYEGKQRWIETKIRNLRDDFNKDVDSVRPGERCCLWIRWKMSEAHHIRVGQVLTPRVQDVQITKKFKALVAIWHHHTSIKSGYVCFVNCNAIKEPVKFTQVDGVLRSGKKSLVTVEFQQHTNVVSPGDVFFFREGNTRGLGKVTSIPTP